MKTKLKIKDYQSFITIKIPFKEKIDTKYNEIISKKYNYGFFKLNKVKRNKLEYCCPIGISLYQRLQNPISEYDFFFIVEQLLDTILKINNIGLSINNLVLDLKLIFFNEPSKELSFIYLPLVSPKNKLDINNCIETIIYLVKPTDTNKSNYLSEFSYFLKKLDKFDIDKIEKYIYLKHEDILKMIKNNNLLIEQDEKKSFYNRILDEEKTDLIKEDNNEKTEIMDLKNSDMMNIYNFHINTENTELMDDEETEIMQDDFNDFQTELITEEKEIYKYPRLIRVLTNEIININKPVFRIGKEEKCVDYVVKDNAAISRSHIDIICRNGKFFVFDLHSKNKSYINDRVIPVEHETEIHNGDTLKLANEEFLFKCYEN